MILVDGVSRSGIRVIQSESNATIKRVRSLLRRKMRYQERAFLVEGVRGVADAIGCGVEPEIVLIDDPSLVERLGAVNPDSLRLVEEPLLRSLSDVGHPQGVIAVFSMNLVPSELPPAWPNRLIVVADGIRDPGNLGTLMRSAAGAGADRLLLSQDSVDPFNPKCVRAAMGAHFRLPLEELDDETLASRLEAMTLVVTAEADGAMEISEIDFTNDVVLIIGGEANGPSLVSRNLANGSVRIPLLRGIESLNAAVAGSLLVFEVARQRRSKDHVL